MDAVGVIEMEQDKMWPSIWPDVFGDDVKNIMYEFLRDYPNIFGRHNTPKGFESTECERTFDADTRKIFADFFQKLHKPGTGDCFEDFKTLWTSSREFMLLCHFLHHKYAFSLFEDFSYSDYSIYVKGSNHESFKENVFEVNKSIATSQSVVLRDFHEFFSDMGRTENVIPLPQVASPVLSEIASFFNMKHKLIKGVKSSFESLAKQFRDTMEGVKGFVAEYEAGVTSFVKTNKSLYPDLHEAANYLNIPTLLELMSMVMGDMKEKSVDISKWYSGLSKLGMLSPLLSPLLSSFRTEIYSIISQLDFFR